MKNNKRIRSQRGQGLVEGAVACCMIFSSGIAATLLLLNSGTTMFFKDKLSHCTHLATQFAAAHQGDDGLQSETSEFVKEIMPQMGLQANGLQVTVKPVAINATSGVQVTVTNSFPVFGGVRFLPTEVAISDSECHIWSF
ncbi:MAG TPA: hypothetical protein V6C76_04735 [Drouetiella sp.]